MITDDVRREVAAKMLEIIHVYCAACGARGDGDPMDAVGARNLWNRGPIKIRAEVA